MLKIMKTFTKLAFLLVLTSSCICYCMDFKEGIFHAKKGSRLTNHTIANHTVDDVIECGIKCIQEAIYCASYNYQHGGEKHRCELNDNRRSLVPDDYKNNLDFTYYKRDGCVPNPCKNGAPCTPDVGIDYYRCKCLPAYYGTNCESERIGYLNAAPSCKQILVSGQAVPDGPYWIDPENSGKPFRAYCDMTTDGGGWLLISNTVVSIPSRLPPYILSTSFHAITNYTNNHTKLSSTALRQLRQHINFTQMRFHCRKRLVRTFHVITKNDSLGAAVVNFFTAETNTRPVACDSFFLGPGDNSKLPGQCSHWGDVGKWGHSNKIDESRMYNHAAFVGGRFHFIILSSLARCDGNTREFSVGDFWKIYVR